MQFSSHHHDLIHDKSPPHSGSQACAKLSSMIVKARPICTCLIIAPEDWRLLMNSGWMVHRVVFQTAVSGLKSCTHNAPPLAVPQGMGPKANWHTHQVLGNNEPNVASKRCVHLLRCTRPFLLQAPLPSCICLLYALPCRLRVLPPLCTESALPNAQGGGANSAPPGGQARTMGVEFRSTVPCIPSRPPCLGLSLPTSKTTHNLL
ncbi:hypothetical protein C8F04DRAFT_1129536 [Mycena alexandri]|uniref:Uncharacterized protein n=1 Tax=Mycena alexandri TaxID=1745969 RepID=A0AAD6WL52_9AGAR|nr:hypothetical protein C8F04DRAFT_1161995 [Mycena alexandri]KAJ7025186.1 hypothetical protein C8F04DRAFT_1129536 [Mycena alexandri]